MSLAPYQKQFIELALSVGALTFGDFTLKSGRKSPYFFNAGLFNTGIALQQLGACFAECIIKQNIQFDTLFGPAYKGISLACSAAIALAEHHNKNIPLTFDRKEAKTHGEGGMLIGAPLKGRVLIIDDVITAGTAKREAIALIQKMGATAAGVIIALDRQEYGQSDSSNKQSVIQELEKNTGTRVYSIIKLADLIKYLENNARYTKQLLAIQQYQAEYGGFS